MRFGVVPELGDQRMAIERDLDETALHAVAPSVDDPEVAQPGGVRRADVFVDDRGDVAGSERVKIEFRLDREPVHHVSPSRSS